MEIFNESSLYRFLIVTLSWTRVFSHFSFVLVIFLRQLVVRET